MASPGALMSLLFAPGTRPSADTIAGLAATGAGTGAGFAVSHRPPEAEGWVELLVNGLTFDCRGLAPAPTLARFPDIASPPGFNAESFAALEAVSLAPGPHLAGGAAMQPIVRGLAGLGTMLARLEGVRAVSWHPSLHAVEPGAFIAQIEQWLGGGAFPGLALTALEKAPDGALQSRGLAFLIGQELRIERSPGVVPAADARLALRLIDRLAATGAIRQAVTVEPLPGERVELIPDEGSALVRVWRRIG